MSIIDHLEELRWRILKSLGAIFFMSIITFNFANYLVDLLIAPANQISGEMNLQVLTIQGMFMLKWNLAIIGGIIFSIPILTVQIWKFLSPGLYDKEKKILFKEEEYLENSLDLVAYIETEIEVSEIQKLIDQLPHGYKTVFVLYVVEGYKHSEISEMLEITESTSKTQLFKARKTLQALINKENKISYGTH